LTESLDNIFTPQVANEARQALRQFLTPPKPPLSEPERVHLAQATSFAIPFDSIELNAFRWGTTGATILLVHGWGSYGLQLNEFIEPLLSAGYQVLAFDAPAHGSTIGEQSNGFEIARAIETVVQYQATSNARATPIEGIVAHSLGAASTSLALSKGMKARKVVYLGAMCSLANAMTLFAKRARLSTDVVAALRHLFESQFGRDVWHRLDIDRTARNLTIPAILFHDRRDREVAFEESLHVSQIWETARLIETSGLGHRRILRDESVIAQTVEFISTPI
jgi:pimeloyl-ACP methyl ester carboxylesterase